MARWAKACGTFGLVIAVAAASPRGAWAQGRSAAVVTDKAALAEAERLNAEVVRLYEAGKYAQALPLAEKAVSHSESAFGPTHNLMATSLNNLAEVYRKQSAYNKAEPLYVRALRIREKALGPQHAATATLLHNLASLYKAQGAYAKAEPLYQRALHIREEALGPDHPDVATSLNNLAALHHAQGAYDKAGPLYQRALDIREKTLGPDHDDVATSLNNLATFYQAQAAYAKAEPLLMRALHIDAKTHGLGHPSTAISLSNLASLYQDWAMYEKAEPLYERALAIFENAFGLEHPNVATVLNNWAGLYKIQAAYGKAEPLYQRALHIREKALGPEHPAVAIALTNLALLYRAQGAYSKAEELLGRALAILERALGPEHPNVAVLLNNWAELYQEQGMHAKAEPLYERALRIDEKMLEAEHPNVATSLTNLASIYQDQGAYKKAEMLLERARQSREKALGPNHPDLVQSLNNLASLHERQGAYQKAEPFYERALRICEKALGAEHPDVATVLNNLGSLYLAQGLPDKAEPLFQRALRIREKVFGIEHPIVATSLNNLATFYQAQADYAKAEPLFVRTLALLEKSLGPRHPNVAAALTNAATFYQTTGDTPRALLHAARAAALREHHLGIQLAVLPEKRKRLLLVKLRSEAEWATSFHIHDAPNDSGALRLALTVALRHKGQVLDELASTRAALRRNLTPALRVDFEVLTTKQTELAALHNAESFAPTKAQQELEEDIERRESELSRKSAAFRAQTTPISLAQAQAALPTDTALVEFVRYHRFDPKNATMPWKEGHYVAYVLRHKGAPQWVSLGKAEPIEKAVRAARDALTERDTDAQGRPTVPSHDARPALRALDALVFAPIRKVLGEVPHLLLAPDGALHTVPFEALVDEQGRYLVEHATVTYLGSGRDLLRMDEHPPSRSGPLVLAAPNYGPSATPFEPLRGAAAEAAVVQRLFPEAQVLTDAAATREALLGAKGPRFALLSTHGFLRHPGLPAQPALPPQAPTARTLSFVEKGTSLHRLPPDEGIDPERSLERAGLALAGANVRPDAIANGRDLAGLDLVGTQLVVLSACETGLGQLEDGEGVYGLRRALAIAGAASQVVSLWNVNDASTGELMGAYFKTLRDGVGRSEALRQAQLEMLKQERYRHPYYWAAFVPAGDWRPLDGGNDVPRVPPGSACGCRLAGAEAGPSGAAFAALALLLVGGARRARPAQRPLR